MKRAELTGRRFGRWTVMERAGRDSYGAARWRCRCDCGAVSTVGQYDLTSGHSGSCGCLRADVCAALRTRHGKATRDGIVPEYGVWNAMHIRCKQNKDYAGRGIRVCTRWSDFAKFYEDMGPRPSPQHTLDRTNNDGNYEPTNCRWATRREQAINRRSSLVIEFRGVSKRLSEWCDDLGLANEAICQRIRRGWSPERALTEPLRRRTA